MRASLAPITITVAAALVALTGCSLLGDSVEDMQMALGECISDSAINDEESDVGALDSVDCSEPHYGEVYFVEDQTDEHYPAGRIDNHASDLCYDNFEPFMGIAYEESAYYITYIVPSSQTWAAGDRQIACLVVGEEDEEINGSLKGSAA